MLHILTSPLYNRFLPTKLCEKTKTKPIHLTITSSDFQKTIPEFEVCQKEKTKQNKTKTKTLAVRK